MNDKIRTFWYSVVVSLSSFLFGCFLTSEQVLMPSLKTSFNNYKLNIAFKMYESLFVYIVFLGAFVSSYFNFFFTNIDRKIVLIINNISYLSGALLTFVSSDIFVLLFSRFLIGIGAGNSCCTVPNYIFSITNNENRGFYMSFHSIGIVIGLVIGKVLLVTFGINGHNSVYMIITSLVVLHTILLCFVKSCPYVSDENDHTTITQLFKNKDARKSIWLAVLFHIAQHACGIEFFTNYAEKILQAQPNAEMQGVYTLTFSAIISIISSFFIDKVGRKFFMIVSTSFIIMSTFLMGLDYLNIPVIYLYLFGYNLGLSAIPWFITNEIFTPKYVMPAMRLTISVNWLSAFVLSVIIAPLHESMKQYLFFIFTGTMAIFLMIVIACFRETKNRPIEFQ